ncbi:YfhO family protein [Hyphomicrobiales bacterium]|nr:YfhO family protein [Hyphomicrobiales bacterium]CAH1700108.1 YfhO family protein [Hyphomicrobiales bacterium]CAI0343870.1 YfhO family protein [Hyphomicrobiales bacterium]
MPRTAGVHLRRVDARGAGYLLAAIGFVLAWVILCWPWLSGSVTIPFDAKAHFQAQVQFLANAIHTGQSPFWNHNVFAGSPQIADPQSLIFSPAILLALLSPAPSFREVDAYVLAHLLAGGLAFILFFRDRGWHPAGGLMAALVFAFGASAAWRVQHVGQIASYAFFAIAFWLTARMLQRSSILSGAFAGFAAGLMVLEPDQVALLGGYVLFGMVVAHWISGGWPALRASLLPITAASVVGFAVIAMPLLWTWLFAEATTRPEIDFGVAARGSLHPMSLLSAFVGDLFGAKDPAVEFWGPYTNPQVLHLSQNMAQVYFGALPLLLLLAPGLTRGWLWDKSVRPLTLMFVFMVLFALGRYTPLFHLAYEYLPGVKQFRRPADATFLIGGLAAVLSGYVLHRILTAEEGTSFRRDLLIGAGMVAATVVLALVVSRGEGHLADAWKPVALALGWFAVAGLAFFVLQRWRGALGTAAAAVLVTGVVAADLGVNNGPNESTALPPQMYDVLEPGTKNETIALLKQLTSQPEGSPRRDRVELLGMGFEWPNAGMVHGFDHTLGYNPLRLEDFSEAVGTGDGIAKPADRKFTPLFPSYRCRLANLLGLRYIASPVPIEQVDHALKAEDLTLIARTKQGYVYENTHALPRVQFVGGWQFADFQSMKLSGRWPETDPQQAVLLDVEPPVATPEGPVAVQADVKLTQYRNALVEVEVTTPAPGFVVLNDIWHPWWKAEVDGVETEILRANVLFRAVQVPAGTHKVRFTFQPLSGAIAELKARIEPEEPEDHLPLPPMEERDAPPVIAAQQGRGPVLAGPSETVRNSLGLGTTQSSALSGTAAAQIPGEISAH